ncbi:hypothetical protein Hypma_012300 [Hypsizygus marmoreus]|uniref:Uncharacterized protein n=1 Tax=Hypsizygus marmoreus TaxID=39966 RepID=A0A369JEX0_HYPMA|nr:hypothetical protein Hypma_012300 [Hypsizygus marmoreus]
MAKSPLSERPFGAKEDIDWQLQEALAYLDEHLRVPYNDMQSEIDAAKEVVENINTLIAVSAFIAGVQAQMISFTSEANTTSLQVATNWFAFVGLTLDIIGTSAGVVRTVHLQHIIRRTERMLRHMVESLDRLRGHISRLQDRESASEHRITEETRAKIATQFEIQARMLGEFQELYKLSTLQTVLEMTMQFADSLPFNPFTLVFLYVMHFPQAMANQVPLILMGGGILCLLMSTLLFAADSQPAGIWAACVGIAGIIAAWSAVSPVFDGNGRQKRLANERIERYLHQSSSI